MHRISEKETRKELIDPALERARWYLRDHSHVRTEIPVVLPFFRRNGERRGRGMREVSHGQKYRHRSKS